MTIYKRAEITSFIDQHYTPSRKEYFNILLLTDPVARKYSDFLADKKINYIFDKAVFFLNNYHANNSPLDLVQLCACLHNLQIKTTTYQIEDLGELASI